MGEIKINCSLLPEEREKFPWDDNALKEFKKLIKDEGLKCRMDDIFLLGFLRSRKFDMQRSLQILKKYYSVRVNYSQYFKDFVPSKLQHVLNQNIMYFLPKPDQAGNYIYIFEFSKWDTSIVNQIDLLRGILMVLDFHLNFHRTQVNKIICIVDAQGLSLSHFLHFSPKFISTMAMLILKDSYPLRFNAIHYVNLNIALRAILCILVPLMPEKLQKRLHFHSEMATLHKFITPECLTPEFEGTLPNSESREVNKVIKVNEELFRMNEEYVKMYEKEQNNSTNEGKFRYINEDFEDEKVKKFIEKSEEKFNTYSEDPEGFFAALKQDSEFEITHF